MMQYRFHPEALDEYEDAARYYADQDEGLKHRFIESVDTRSRESPEAFPIIDDDFRRCVTGVFPYGIVYIDEPGYIFIVAVAHSSREPGYWKGRID